MVFTIISHYEPLEKTLLTTINGWCQLSPTINHNYDWPLLTTKLTGCNNCLTITNQQYVEITVINNY